MDGENKLEGLGKILIYQTEKGDTKIDVYFQDENIWMSQRNIAELYQVTPKTINEHIINIYRDKELEEVSTIRNFRIVQIEGLREIGRKVKHYNLNMILAIGYRVRNNRGIHFRRWASNVLTEYMKKGFVMNDERLKNPKEFGADYFHELLERIREIRASEARFYHKVKEIFATSIDYDSQSEQADLFFKTVQNKLHYATHGHTAPELIAERADAAKDNMGLTSFKGAKVRKSDVTVAKNYLNKEEMDFLNRIVSMYLDYAELMAKRQMPMYMRDWEKKLGEFLEFNEREVLDNPGKVSREAADALAVGEYIKFDEHRRMITSDFDELHDEVKKSKN
mgnify:FL=1